MSATQERAEIICRHQNIYRTKWKSETSLILPNRTTTPTLNTRSSSIAAPFTVTFQRLRYQGWHFSVKVSLSKVANQTVAQIPYQPSSLRVLPTCPDPERDKPKPAAPKLQLSPSYVVKFHGVVLYNKTSRPGPKPRVLLRSSSRSYRSGS